MQGIVLVASDTAPFKALGMVADELRKRGEIVTLAHGQGEFIVSDKTSLVLTGMAHTAFSAESELQALKQAAQLKVPCGLYADTFDCAGRPWFEEVRNSIDFLFVPTETEAKKAAVFFPEAVITATGNPIWQASGFPVASQMEARKRLGVQGEQKAVLCPLRKEASINIEHLRLLREALVLLPSNIRESTFVFVGIHPGDQGFKNNPKIYQGALPPLCEIIPGTPTREVLPGINVVVNAASGAGIDAIYQRVPVIEVLTKQVLDEVERLHGRRAWQPVEDGVATAVQTPEGLSIAIMAAFNPWSKRSLGIEVRQKEHYPLPEHPDQAVLRMTNLIQSHQVRPRALKV